MVAKSSQAFVTIESFLVGVTVVINPIEVSARGEIYPVKKNKKLYNKASLKYFAIKPSEFSRCFT